jgi:hypothetical protein
MELQIDLMALSCHLPAFMLNFPYHLVMVTALCANSHWNPNLVLCCRDMSSHMTYPSKILDKIVQAVMKIIRRVEQNGEWMFCRAWFP